MYKTEKKISISLKKECNIFFEISAATIEVGIFI